MKPSPRAHAPFVSRHVNEAPASPGVFLLYRRGRLVYSEFDFEASPYPVSLYRQYFAVYLGTSAGRLPECNEAVVDEVSLERNGPCLSCRK